VGVLCHRNGAEPVLLIRVPRLDLVLSETEARSVALLGLEPTRQALTRPVEVSPAKGEELASPKAREQC